MKFSPPTSTQKKLSKSTRSEVKEACSLRLVDWLMFSFVVYLLPNKEDHNTNSIIIHNNSHQQTAPARLPRADTSSASRFTKPRNKHDNNASYEKRQSHANQKETHPTIHAYICILLHHKKHEHPPITTTVQGTYNSGKKQKEKKKTKAGFLLKKQCNLHY